MEMERQAKKLIFLDRDQTLDGIGEIIIETAPTDIDIPLLDLLIEIIKISCPLILIYNEPKKSDGLRG